LPCPGADVENVSGIIERREIVLVLKTEFEDFILKVESVGFGGIVREIVCCKKVSIRRIAGCGGGIEGSYSLLDIHDMCARSPWGIRKHSR
jgi:hypothetical protein